MVSARFGIALVLCLAVVAAASDALESGGARHILVAPSVPVDDAFMKYLLSKPGMPPQLRANFSRQAVEAYFDMPNKRVQAEGLAHLPPLKEGEDGGGGSIDPKVLEMIGKALWDMVKSGKSTVDATTDYGGAVPAGSDWQQMSHWQERIWSEPIPQMRYVWHNAFGNQVVFNWFWSWNYNGRYQNAGQYIALGTAVPLLIDASWGYDVKARVSVSTPLNYGKSHVVSGVTFQLVIDVTNWRGGSEKVTHICVLKGDGSGSAT